MLSSKRRVTILAPNHLSSTPRAVRNANALAAAGFDVTVVYGQVTDELRDHDALIVRQASWRAIAIDLTLETISGWLRRRLGRVRQELALRASEHVASAWIAAYGLSPLAPLVAKHARGADVVLAQQHAMLPFAYRVAKQARAKLIVDVEDLLADSPAEPVAVIRMIEREFLPECAAIVTMSPAAARRLAETNSLRHEPVAIYNTPSLSERRSLASPSERSPLEEAPSIYWFGQTIGTQSCADLLLRAAGRTRLPFKVALRGRPRPDFVEPLLAGARASGIGDRIALLPRADPDRMVELAAQHHLLFGSQPTGNPFNELAIGNKVFTGLMAGLPVLLTETRAHRELYEAAPAAMRMYRDGDAQSLADAIQDLAADAGRLRRAQIAAWDVATAHFNWEVQSQKLVQSVEQVLTSSR